MQDILQVKRHEETGKRIAAGDNQKTDNAEAEAADLEQLKIDKRAPGARLVNDKADQAREKDNGQENLGRACEHRLAAPVEHKYHRRGDCEQQRRAEII